MRWILVIGRDERAAVNSRERLQEMRVAVAVVGVAVAKHETPAERGGWQRPVLGVQPQREAIIALVMVWRRFRSTMVKSAS